MPNTKIPSILIDLAHVGRNGLPLTPDPLLQHELEICKKWGFPLNISDNRVSLVFDQEQLIPYWIQKEAASITWDYLRVHGYLSVDSTNNEAVQMARQGSPAGTLIYAEEQTAGKGRAGRDWYSPAKSGLYFSLILRPKQPQRYWPLVTHVAAIALADTLKALPDRGLIPHSLDVDLKWPNDVLLDGKKCAGILLETAETENLNRALILGVGVNVHERSDPESSASEAVCLDEAAGTVVPRRQLLVQFLFHFQLVYQLFEKEMHSELLERWESLSSMWNEVPIWIHEGGERKPAVTCGLNELGALLVRTEEGAVETIVAGDISIRREQKSQRS
jgi:BirA family biotin operon repressor/biotin-[acetyl-CoA-carboxylase] ligase